MITSFLPLFLAYMFTPYVTEWKHTRGEGYVQTLLSIAGFVLFVLMMSWVAFLRGKRRTKKGKLTSMQYNQASSMAMGAYILSAIIIASLVGNVEATIRIIAFYLPFLFLKGVLVHAQLSIILLGFVSWAAQAGSYALGRIFWEKSKDKY